MHVAYNRPDLPVLHDCDVVVVDGSLGGIAAALTLARAGKRVAVVESRTYLGREIAATLRPWIPVPADGDAASLPPLISAALDASGTSAADGEFPLHMDAVKTLLEDQLLDAGIRLLYASRPVGLCTEGDVLRGLVIGNKSGRQVLTCRAILDTSTTAIVATLAGAEFENASADETRFSRTIEFDRVADIDGLELKAPAHVGLVGDAVRVHRSYRGPEYILLEHELLLPARAEGALDLARREAQARRKTAALAAYLCSEVPAFEKAYPGVASYELHGPHAPRMSETVPGWAESLGRAEVEAPGNGGQRSRVSSFAGPLRGLWCLNDSVRVDRSVLAQMRTPVVSASVGAALGGVIAERWDVASAPDGGAASGSGTTEPGPPAPSSAKATEGSTLRSSTGAKEGAPEGPHLEIREQDQPAPGRTYERCAAAPQPIPVVHTADVLVVGGGSSGAIAAISAAREGARTVLVDMNPGLGGTGTYGGIDAYWFAQRKGFVAGLMDWLDTMHDSLALPRPEGPMAKWNIEARIWVLMDQAENAGATLLMNSTAIAAICEGRAVRGVVAATPAGPVAVLGTVVIDATGDGDVAAFAGADCVYGASRDHTVMYGYMPQAAGPGRYRNVKTSMVDITDIEDYTRMILAERRRRREGDHDHGVYLAPRESRHVTGDVTLTLTDQLVRRCWPDVVYVAFSNCDMKGQCASDWLRMGLQSPNLEIEIPYRALLPKGLEGILVVGKAFSATHDGIAAPRMQDDLENLGGVAGLAAVAAVRSGAPPRAIDLTSLQADLVGRDLLPDSALGRTLVPLRYSDAELESLVESLDGTKPLHSYSDQEIGEHYHGRVPIVEVMCAGPHAVRALEKTLGAAAGPRRVLLAQALAGLGSRAGVPVLVSAIEGALSDGRLPGRKTKIRHAGFPPNQGAAPGAAYLIYSLGMARDGRALAVWERVVDLLASATDEDVLDRTSCRYYYVDAVCFGAERLGDSRAVPILKRLHGYAPFHGRESLSGCQADWFEERRAYLELVIGRALARCGSADGYRVLIRYLDDVRAILAAHALSELVAVAGGNGARNRLCEAPAGPCRQTVPGTVSPAAWTRWLAERGEDLSPAAWTEPLEAVASWNEEMLTEAPAG